MNGADTLLANFTAVTPVKFVPVMVTFVPTTPLAGVTFVTLRQDIAWVMVKV